VHLRVIGRTDLRHEKLRAATGLARRRSKRLQDLADAHALLESTPMCCLNSVRQTALYLTNYRGNSCTM
jgi:hypothetical protein